MNGHNTLRFLPIAAVFAVAAIFGVLFTSCKPSGEPARLDIQLTGIFQIGENDPVALDEYLFEAIASIATDSRGNIYVCEFENYGVKVYDSEGNYVRSIGRMGDGPGEFREVSTVHVDRNDRLVAFDRMNGRITRFTREGDLIDSVPFPFPGIAHLRRILELDDDRLLFLYGSLDLKKMVHKYDGSLQEPRTSFVPFDEIRYTDSQFEEWYSMFMPGWIAPFGPSDILYVPYLYGGSIYHYRQEEDGGWSHAGTLNGKADHSMPIREIDIDGGEQPDGVLGTFDGMLAAIFYQRSQGLFTLSDGRIVHFSAVRTTDGNLFRAELFDAGGTLIGYSDILSSGGEHMRVLWKDDDDYFYVADDRDFPKLAKIRLDL